MGINRRDFIKLIVGGVAGIHVTPLPWKLTDDIAIWTQNWPWVPVPERGEFKEARSICSLCQGGCGIRLRLVDKRGVKIEPMDEYPVNHGGICPIGVGGLQLLYNKDMRFTSPMKRVGPRGEGLFVDISWEEAIDILTKRLKALREENKGHYLAVLDGLPYEGTESSLVRRFLEAYGSPNYVRMLDQEMVDRLVNIAMHGINGPMGFDLENSDYVLSFGAGLLEGWGVSGRLLNLWGQWKGKKVKVVQIESRASNTASKADKWLAVRPGTEAALALGILRELVQRGRYNVDFVNEYTFGFGDFVDQDGKTRKGLRSLIMESYSPEKVAHITGIQVQEIGAIASELEAAKAPLVVWGRGKGELPMGIHETMAIHSLNVILGRIQRPGGVIVKRDLPFSEFPSFQTDSKASGGLKKEPIGKRGLDGSISLFRFVKAVLENKEVPLDTLMIFQANPIQSMPGSTLLEKALKKIPFIVCFSPFRDDTSNYADLILPDHGYLEKYQEVANPKGLGYAAYCISAPVLPAIYKTKSIGDTLIQVAQGIGEGVKEAFPFKNYEEALKHRASGLFQAKGAIKLGKEPPWKWNQTVEAGLSGDPKKDWEALLKSNIWYMPNSMNSTYVFPTESKKVEFYSLTLKRNRGLIGAKEELDYLPHFRPLEDGKEGVLLMPYEMANWSSGWAPSPPYLTKTLLEEVLQKQDLFFEINPRTAKELGLKEGDYVELHTRLGEIRMRAHLFEGAMPNVIYAPLGFGHIGYDEFLKGKGVNIAKVLWPQEDPVSGAPLWWGTKVKITRV